MKNHTTFSPSIFNCDSRRARILLGYVAIGLSSMLLTTAANANSLLNLNFGASWSATKTGPAALGNGAGDYWNFYSRNGAGEFDWLTFGVLSDLKWTDGTSSGAGMTVANAPGAWANNSADPMYRDYIYPFSGNATITITNLSFGLYDVYVFCFDGNYNLSAGNVDMGNKSCRDDHAFTSNPGVPAWQEGVHYVRYQNVAVANGDALNLTVQNGVDGYAVISGLQIVAVPEPSAGILIVAAGWLLARRKLRWFNDHENAPQVYAGRST